MDLNAVAVVFDFVKPEPLGLQCGELGLNEPGMSGLVRLPQLTKKPRHRWGTADDGSLTIKEPQYSNVVSKPVGISHVFK